MEREQARAHSERNDLEFAADEFEAGPEGQDTVVEEEDTFPAPTLEGTGREDANPTEGQTARDTVPEDEGVPGVIQDESPMLDVAEDPQFAPLPRETAGASVDWGTTAFEQSQGESLAGRLEREMPDDTDRTRTAEDLGRSPAQYIVGADTGPYDGLEDDAVTDTVGAAERQSTGGDGPEERAMHTYRP